MFYGPLLSPVVDIIGITADWPVPVVDRPVRSPGGPNGRVIDSRREAWPVRTALRCVIARITSNQLVFALTRFRCIAIKSSTAAHY